MPSFSDLSDDILFLIANYLHPHRQRTLLAFRLVSKRFKYFTESVLCRTVVLEEDDEEQEQASCCTIQRILDAGDDLRNHVRYLHIRSFRGDSDSYCMNTDLVAACLKKIRKLDVLRWDAAVHLPATILETLELFHPGAELCITTKSLAQGAVEMPHSRQLSVSIPVSDITHPHDTTAFEDVRALLLGRQNLRSFAFNVYQDVQLRRQLDALEHEGCHCGIWRHCECVKKWATSTLPMTNNVQIPLRPGDRLPQLEAFSIKAMGYAFDTEHSVQLCDSLDLRRLKSLTIASSRAEEFFRHLTNRVPGLQHLDIAYHYEPGKPFAQTQYIHTDVITLFIYSITALRSVKFRCNNITMKEVIWDILKDKHGASLESISIQPRCPSFEVVHSIDPEHLLSFLGGLPKVTECNITLPTTQLPLRWNLAATQQIDFQYDWMKRHFQAIPSMPAIQTLHISTHMHRCWDRPLHEHAAYQARGAIHALWTRYANSYAKEDRTLEEIKLTFWQWTLQSPLIDGDRERARTRLSSVVFSGWLNGDELVIKSRNKGKPVIVRYKEKIVQDDEVGLGRIVYVGDTPEQSADLNSKEERGLGDWMHKYLGCFLGE